MHFEYNERTQFTLARIRDFIEKHIHPNEETFYRQLEGFGSDRWRIPPILEELKAKARDYDRWLRGMRRLQARFNSPD